MPKRLLLSVLVVGLAVAACKGNSSSPTPTPSVSPTPEPTASTASVTASYNGNPYSAVTSPPNGDGTIYMNSATYSSSSGCQGSTSVTASTVSSQTNAQGVAVFSNLTPTSYYMFFYVASSSGPIVSSCTDLWSLGVTLKYP